MHRHKQPARVVIISAYSRSFGGRFESRRRSLQDCSHGFASQSCLSNRPKCPISHSAINTTQIWRVHKLATGPNADSSWASETEQRLDPPRTDGQWAGRSFLTDATPPNRLTALKCRDHCEEAICHRNEGAGRIAATAAEDNTALSGISQIQRTSYGRRFSNPGWLFADTLIQFTVSLPRFAS